MWSTRDLMFPSGHAALKSCPFCGCAARGPHWSEDHDRNSGNWWIECMSPVCTANLWVPAEVCREEDKAAVVEHWNMRAVNAIDRGG